MSYLTGNTLLFPSCPSPKARTVPRTNWSMFCNFLFKHFPLIQKAEGQRERIHTAWQIQNQGPRIQPGSTIWVARLHYPNPNPPHPTVHNGGLGFVNREVKTQTKHSIRNRCRCAKSSLRHCLPNGVINSYYSLSLIPIIIFP